MEVIRGPPIEIHSGCLMQRKVGQKMGAFYVKNYSFYSFCFPHGTRGTSKAIFTQPFVSLTNIVHMKLGSEKHMKSAKQDSITKQLRRFL